MDKMDPEKARVAERRREERMRYEVLAMLCRASGGDTTRVIDCARLAEAIGVWSQELFRVVDFLANNGLVSYAGSGSRVSVTDRGIALIGTSSDRVKSIGEWGYK